MELIRDIALGVVGERYRSFSELYRENERRALNALSAPRGDGAAAALFEADEGVTFSFEDTRRALLYGTDLFDERFEQARASALDVLRHHYEWREQPRADTDVLGHNVVVERYAAGHPEAFSRKRPAVRKQRSVNVFYDAMCAASTPTSARIEAGCCVLAAVEALGRLGYEAAVSFVLAKYSGQPAADDPTLVLEVALKSYGEPLNARRMQFPLAGKPVLFHVGCWWAHRFPHAPVDYGAGEGYPVSYEQARVQAMERYAEKMHGVYLSEDIVELRLHMDPVKVLERILGNLGTGDELAAHLRAKTPIAAAVQPEQGKMFASWEPGGDEDAGTEAGAGLAGAAYDDGHVAGEGGGDAAGAGDGSGDGGDSGVGDSAVGDHGLDGRHTPLAGMHEPVRAQRPEASEDPEAPEAFETPEAPEASSAPGGAREPEPGTSHAPAADAGERPAPKAAAGDADRADAGGTPEDDAAGSQPQVSDDGEEDQSMDEDEVIDIRKADEPEPEFEPEPEPDEVERQAHDEFIVKLRKRFVRFEEGAYLQHMIADKMAKRQAAKAHGSGAPLAPPPTAADKAGAPMGNPRNTPFTMSYL